MLNMRAYLVLKEPELKKLRDKAREDAIATMEEYEKDGSILFEDLAVTADGDNSYEIDDNALRVWGDISLNGESFGFLSIDIPLDFDMVTSIIEEYVSRVNKVKAILEAAK